VPVVGERVGSLRDFYEPALTTAPRGSTGGQDALAAAWSHQVAHLTEQGVAMVAAHTLGAVVLGLVLAHGERVLRTVLALGAARLGAGLSGLLDRLRPAPVPAPVRLRSHVSGPDRVRILDLTRALPRRGPPVAPAA
jgi:hypothetical protein